MLHLAQAAPIVRIRQNDLHRLTVARLNHIREICYRNIAGQQHLVFEHAAPHFSHARKRRARVFQITALRKLAAQKFDIILTHAGADTHADHRETHEASISALRNYKGTVLLYQSPSTKPNSFHPTLFVNLTEEAIRQKDRALQAHASQQNKDFMKIARTVGLATSWALFHHMTEMYCEAFEIYKWFWL